MRAGSTCVRALYLLYYRRENDVNYSNVALRSDGGLDVARRTYQSTTPTVQYVSLCSPLNPYLWAVWCLVIE